MCAGFFLSLVAANSVAAAESFTQTDVFVSGTGGYHTCRIPAMVVSTNGTVLAFCEGRKNSASDTGDIDLLLKRSPDGGQTWSAQQVVWSDGNNTCGNPAPVVDRDTGTIWLLMTWNSGSEGERAINNGTSKDTRRVFVTSSHDDGLTWSKPREITGDVKKPDWRWYATGPVNGIQLTRGKYRGRLVIPANHTEVGEDGNLVSHSQIIYSDDHGKTWHLGGVAGRFTNESTVTECADGSLLLNMRSYRGKHRRAIARSRDGGATWSEVTSDETLIEPVCQGSILRDTWPDASQKSRILFSNPASLKRERMTVRVSYDEGATWPVSKLVHGDPSAYSCLAVLPNNQIGCLYECGKKSAYEKIALARMSMDWLEAGPSARLRSGATQANSTAPERSLVETVPASLVAQISQPARPTEFNWKQLPPIPDPLGLAGPFAGSSDGALIVAGGANFPHGMPWEGGEKVWYDSVFVLTEPEGKWRTGFKLPHPLGYGVSVTTPAGVLCAGGGDAKGNSRGVFLAEWADGTVKFKSLPLLPKAMANGCGALVGTTVYIAGGIETPDATEAMKTFWALDLSAPELDWRPLAPWPGPARMLAVAGAYDGKFYLFSGAELHADADGKPARTYLKDAYSFVPGEGWTRLADLPRPAVAAPSPAIQWKEQLLVVSGDDGKLVNFEPKAKHPGFPKDVLAYDPASDQWNRVEESPLSRATAPTGRMAGASGHRQRRSPPRRAHARSVESR